MIPDESNQVVKVNSEEIIELEFNLGKNQVPKFPIYKIQCLGSNNRSSDETGCLEESRIERRKNGFMSYNLFV